ncbi:MAG: hypothetical protein PHS92_02085 [Candidatus Gracilibacteria bacterium]|nr:hypothetical protein [Candidatus Gracilibacteria bacterium]
MNKFNKYLSLGLGAVGALATTASTFASTYTLSGSEVTSLGGASTDIANSLFGSLATLLPVFIPLIVIGFVIGMVRSYIGKR